MGESGPVNQVASQNGSFLNGLIGLLVNQVESENSNPFCDVYVYVEAEIALGKYVLSSGDMTGSRAMCLITQFAVFQGLIDVALKTYGIGYTLDYNDPAGTTIDVIKVVTWVDNCKAYDKIDDITTEVTTFSKEFKMYLSGLRNSPPK